MKGAIITRGRNDADVWLMGENSISQNSTWFLVETNYDHWKPPPFFDDRRSAAIKCLDTMGKDNASFSGLYNVLSTKPVLNEVSISYSNLIKLIDLFTTIPSFPIQLTTYTCLMDVSTGKMEAWLRYCPHPCKPW